MHDRLQDGSERCDADTGSDQDRMLSSEDVTRRRSIGSIDENLNEIDLMIGNQEEISVANLERNANREVIKVNSLLDFPLLSCS